MKSILVALLLVFGGVANAQVVLYDTFDEQDTDPLFAAERYQQLFGQYQRQNPVALAIDFVPTIDSNVTEIDLALGTESEGSTADAELRDSAAGVPGQLKQRWKLSNLPVRDQCCQFISVIDAGVPVKRGHRYWVVVRALGNSWVWWHDTKGHQRGREATYEGDLQQWDVVRHRLPAVRVLGE